MQWKGVMPAITTAFDADLKVDVAAVEKHCRWMIESGCTGIIALGSLGEGATLSYEEKLDVVSACVRAVGKTSPIVAAISALSTAEAVKTAKASADRGCRGLMVLPPYVYKGDWREMRAHMSAVIRATPLPCMLYNNPISYGTDFLPEQIADLAAEHANLQAVKESSADVRRVTAIRAITGDRLQIFVGVDDAILEGIAMGAVGWVAGLVNAFPRESVQLFDLAIKGEREIADELYRWFLPLLRMDTVPKFVQLIKQVQQEVGKGSARVRMPRMEVVGAELEECRAVVREALASRPEVTV